MNPYNSLNVDSTDDIFHQILRVKTRFYQINTANEPLFACFPFLKTNIASCLELSKQLPDRNFIDVSQFLIYRVKDTLNVVNFFFFQIINLLELLYFLNLHSNIVYFNAQIRQVFINAV